MTTQYSMGLTRTPPSGDEVLDKLIAERDAMEAALVADTSGPYQITMNSWTRVVHGPATVRAIIAEWNQKIEGEIKIKAGRNPRFGGRVRL